MDSGWAKTPFGDAFLTWTDTGLAGLIFPPTDHPSAVTPNAQAQTWIERILADEPISLDLRGTPFQQAVWQALRAIPVGQTRCYQDIAQAIGNPRAIRAAASAVAHNPLAWVIPCHRVVPKHKRHIGNYRWGAHIKEAMLKHEHTI